MILLPEVPFIGLTMDNTRADMTQAVLEGVAFAMRDSFEVAKPWVFILNVQKSAAAVRRARCGVR